MWEDDNGPIIKIKLWLVDFIFFLWKLPLLCHCACHWQSIALHMAVLRNASVFHLFQASIHSFYIVIVCTVYDGWLISPLSTLCQPVCQPAFSEWVQLNCQASSCHQVAVMFFCFFLLEKWIELRWSKSYEPEAQLDTQKQALYMYVYVYVTLVWIDCISFPG